MDPEHTCKLKYATSLQLFYCQICSKLVKQNPSDDKIENNNNILDNLSSMLNAPSPAPAPGPAILVEKSQIKNNTDDNEDPFENFELSKSYKIKVKNTKYLNNNGYNKKNTIQTTILDCFLGKV